MNAPTADTRLRGRTRWSMAARCPRQAALGLLGADPEEPTDRQRGLMRRGRDAQRYELERVHQDHPDAVAEKAVPWPAPPALPAGELHVDIFIPSEARAEEVKCSSVPDSMFESAMTQLAGEVYFDPEAEYGALKFISPIDYSYVAIYPLVINDEWVEIVEGIAEQVVDAGKTGTLPSRTCRTPGEGVGKLCPFISQCFDGWEPPETVELGDEHAPLLLAAHQARRDYDAAGANSREAEAAWKAATAALAEAGVPVGESVGAGFRVRRTHVAGSERLAWSKARKSGVVSEATVELLSPFVSVGGGHDRWTIEKVGPAPAPEFGDEAPWSDQDLEGPWA